jgi:hypothetical protein
VQIGGRFSAANMRPSASAGSSMLTGSARKLTRATREPPPALRRSSNRPLRVAGQARLRNDE